PLRAPRHDQRGRGQAGVVRARFEGTLMRRALWALLILGCTSPARHPYATTGGALSLSKVVLYRNGVGYFERAGHVDGEQLTIRVRKDQVNDLLKSLTVVEKTGGRAV